MGGGDSGGSRVNHYRFGEAFIRRHLLPSANMIDYTTELMIMVSTVMDALLTAVPQGRSCPCFWHNGRLLISRLYWVSNVSLLAIPEVNGMRPTKRKTLNLPCLICQPSSAE